MLRKWLRRRGTSELRTAVLQSSAVGLMHFPDPTMPLPTERLASEIEAANLPTSRRIVVGVTHDRGARNALRWAYQSAVANDATLVVVTAFEPPRPALTIYGWAFIDPRDAAAAAEFVQDNVLREELPAESRRAPVRTVIARGEPASVLVDAARSADLLVLGRGTSRLWRVASRSISRRCANCAVCPVVIVGNEVDSRRRSDPPMGSGLAAADRSPGRKAVRTAGARAHHARGHPQFEIRRRGH
jgi:nucleotide-binding universal stress UspA family protein